MGRLVTEMSLRAQEIFYFQSDVTACELWRRFNSYGYRYSSIFYPSLNVVGIQAPNSILLIESWFCLAGTDLCLFGQSFSRSASELIFWWSKMSSFQWGLWVQVLTFSPAFLVLSDARNSDYSDSISKEVWCFPASLWAYVFGHWEIHDQCTFSSQSYCLELQTSSCNFMAALISMRSKEQVAGMLTEHRDACILLLFFFVCDTKYSLSTLLNLWFSDLKSNMQDRNKI